MMTEKEDEDFRKRVDFNLLHIGLRHFIASPDRYWKMVQEVLYKLEEAKLEEKGYAEKQTKEMKDELYGKAAPLINSPNKAKEYLKKVLKFKNIRKMIKTINNNESVKEKAGK